MIHRVVKREGRIKFWKDFSRFRVYVVRFGGCLR